VRVSRSSEAGAAVAAYRFASRKPGRGVSSGVFPEDLKASTRCTPDEPSLAFMVGRDRFADPASLQHPPHWSRTVAIFSNRGVIPGEGRCRRLDRLTHRPAFACGSSRSAPGSPRGGAQSRDRAPSGAAVAGNDQAGEPPQTVASPPSAGSRRDHARVRKTDGGARAAPQSIAYPVSSHRILFDTLCPVELGPKMELGGAVFSFFPLSSLFYSSFPLLRSIIEEK